MTFPTGQVSVPDVVARIAAGRTVAPAWVNELGGVTFAVGDQEYVKVYPGEHAALLLAEETRLRWAGGYLAVPRVLSSGPGWLHTAALPGRSAVDPYWTARPVTAVRAIGAGLRIMHDALPVATCPFGRPAWVPADAPPPDRLVVCHGDACAPNTLLADDGTWAAHVDLGALGVADRWADLAVATWSTQWNYGPGWEEPLLEAYGVEADPERTTYYRLLWELAD